MACDLRDNIGTCWIIAWFKNKLGTSETPLGQTHECQSLILEECSMNLGPCPSKGKDL
jgi:hypothetical protein